MESEQTRNNGDNQNMSLKPHQQRVVDEKKELDEKISKLSKFICADNFAELIPSNTERMLLIMQIQPMSQYSKILEERIKYFN